MPIVVIIAAFLTLFVAVGVRNIPHNNLPVSPAPSVSISPTASVSPTPTANSFTTPVITKKITTPTATPIVIRPPVQKTPTAIPLQLGTNTPMPSLDTAAPTFDFMTGPGEGTTVDFNQFCFPMKFSDVTAPIQVRYGLDAQAPSDWNQNYAPCYSSVSNGAHTFRVSAKDGAGNISELVKRNFIVQVADPANQITQSPTPTLTGTP